MLSRRHIKKVTAIVVFSLVTTLSFASFTLTGTVDEKASSNKYSLKNINHYSKKSFSLSLYKTNLQNHGSLQINTRSNSTFLQIDRGNTTYVMPYNYKIKTPKFKTPSPNN